MNTLDFLENFAKEAHYSPRITKLVEEQPSFIQEAVRFNDSTLIQNGFANVGYLANGTTAVEL